MTPAALPSRGLTYQNQTIHERGEMLSLTDMWRAAGGDDSKRPVYWVRQDGTQAFIEHLVGTMIPDHSDLIQSLNEGGTWNTWAHWQIAMAYAKYLSPEFHAWCNQVVRDHMEGRLVPVQATGALIAITDAAFREMMLPMTEGIRELLEGQHRTDTRLERVERQQQTQEQSIHEIWQEIRGRRRRISDKTKALLVWQLHCLGGRCPCCARQTVVEQQRRVNNAEFDHFMASSLPDENHVWLICKTCHDDLTTGRVARDQRLAEFNAFQNQRRRTPGAQPMLALVA